MTKPLKVLLVSPVAGVDPQSGDVVYTECLLENPPPGVEYTTYTDALATGDLVELGRRGFHRRQVGIGRKIREAAIFTSRSVEVRVRGAGLAFREPFRYFATRPGAFDLVHGHVFRMRLVDQNLPLVMSAAGSLSVPYRDAWDWSPARVHGAEVFDSVLARAMGVNDFSGRMPQAYAAAVFSGVARDDERLRAARIEVIPNFVNDRELSTRSTEQGGHHLGFVATDFDTKGGDVVIEAFRRVRARRPDARLTIVGSTPRMSEQELAENGISWFDRIPRGQVLGELLPSLDLFVYPTRCDGLPYIVMEAMGTGVPIVSSAYGALPELIGAGGRCVEGYDPDDFAAACLELLDEPQNNAAGAAARDRFLAVYSDATVLDQMHALYLAAVADRREPRP